ncbi:unnamed protein product [Alopecurus aequalis]
MKSKGLTRQQRRSQSKLATPRRKKTEEVPSVRKRDSSTNTAKETRVGAATPYTYTEDVEDELSARDNFYHWYMRTWGDVIGSMEHRTLVPSMRFTDLHVPPRGPVSSPGTLQVFTLRISLGDTSSLSWPLHVYGVFAARDNVDFKRNVIFERGRDDCQTITEEAPYLALTGPTRAIVMVDPVYFEADLKLKGTEISEDQDLIFLAEAFRDPPHLSKWAYKGKISTLELTFGHIDWSIEATISMRVIHGSWPDGCRGSFAAKTASIDGMEFALLLTGDDDKLPVADDGTIELQRQVVCVLICMPRESIWKFLSRPMVLLGDDTMMLCFLNLSDAVDCPVCLMLVPVRLRSLSPGPL